MLLAGGFGVAGFILASIFPVLVAPLIYVGFIAVISFAWAIIIKNKMFTLWFGVTALLHGTERVPAGGYVTAFWCSVSFVLGLICAVGWHAYA